MKLTNIVDQNDKELQQLVASTRTELAEVIVQLRTEKTPNVKRISGLKKTIARALTIERQRALTNTQNAKSDRQPPIPTQPKPSRPAAKRSK